MKYIERWALMRNSEKENISEHSLEVAMIAHALAVLGGKTENVYEISVKGEDWTHYILHVIKEKPTGKAYPRRQGKISKAPL